MVYKLVKIAVGAILMVDYSLPLVIVLRRRSLWDEPMVLLVADLCALNLSFGTSHTIVGLMDVLWHPPPDVPCAAVMSSSAGSAISIKLTHVALALDQYVAISRPLHYYPRMEKIAGPFVLFSWAWAALHMAGGLSTHLAGLETAADVAERASNTTASPFSGCRWERVMPSSFMAFCEVEVFLFSVCTSSIFMYTGLVGWREQRRMKAARARSRREPAQREETQFLDKFRAFKRVLRLMFLALTLDVVGSLLRLSSPWYPMPQLNGIIHQLRLSLGVVEGWVYGLHNRKMKAAYVDALGCCCGPWLRGGACVRPMSPAGQPAADDARPLEQNQQQSEQDDKHNNGDVRHTTTCSTPFSTRRESELVSGVEGKRSKVSIFVTTANSSNDNHPHSAVPAWPA